MAAGMASSPHRYIRVSSTIVEVDYLLRVVVPDIAAYDAFYKRLIEDVDIADVSSSFAMEQIKFTTELPLNYAQSEEKVGAGSV